MEHQDESGGPVAGQVRRDVEAVVALETADGQDAAHRLCARRRTANGKGGGDNRRATPGDAQRGTPTDTESWYAISVAWLHVGLRYTPEM